MVMKGIKVLQGLALNVLLEHQIFVGVAQENNEPVRMSTSSHGTRQGSKNVKPIVNASGDGTSSQLDTRTVGHRGNRPKVMK